MRADVVRTDPPASVCRTPRCSALAMPGRHASALCWFWLRGRRGSVPPVTGAERGGQGSQGGKAVNQAGQASLHRGLLSLGWAGQRHL
jgi:hypothetical protein